VTEVDVLIVGAGPAGLAAAVELRRLGAGRVLVADREQAAGGVPRHCAHTGYGLRDLHRVMTGPAYARHYAELARQAGAEVLTGTTVTGWDEPGRVSVTSPAGLRAVSARAVLLATGCRERPRSARLVPGSRPPGVMTTGELQQRVYLHGQRLPGRALVVGAEHVSYSAMVTLDHAGARVVALVTDEPRPQSYAAFRLGAAVRWQVPVWTQTAVTGLSGRDHLAGAELTDLRTGAIRPVACDTVVFTGDWIPDHELARLAGLDMDPGSRSPVTDTALATSAPVVYAAGNLVHPAETADVAALSGRHAARQIAAALRRRTAAGGPAAAAPDRPAVPVLTDAPLAWISPSAIRDTGTAPPRGRFVLRSTEFRPHARLSVTQDGRSLATARLTLRPARSLTLSASWLTQVDVSGGAVRVGVV
jgi:thioredoxin reductase